MKTLLLILNILFLNVAFSKTEVVKCGDGANDSRSLEWRNALDISIDIKIIRHDAVLCLGNKPGDLFDIQEVIYRDTTSLEKKFKFADLSRGTQVLLNSDDIDFGAVKKGDIMTLQLKQVNIGDRPEDGKKYLANLRFLRNLANIPFDSKDFRQISVEIEQDAAGDFYPRFNEVDFDRIKINITAPALVIDQIDLIHHNSVELSIKTKKLAKVDEL